MSGKDKDFMNQIERSPCRIARIFRGGAEFFPLSAAIPTENWLGLRGEVQKLYSISETVAKVCRNGDAGLGFDSRHNAGHAVMFLDHLLRPVDPELTVPIRRPAISKEGLRAAT
jgi:hypothetical protein